MPSFLPVDPILERRVREIGEKLFAAMEASPAPGIFSRKGAYARLMEWAMKDPAFKAQLFRFVDVLPTLDSSAEVVRHLQEYLGEKTVVLNPAMRAGLAASSLAPGLVAGPVKANVQAMAAQFVAGTAPDDLVRRLLANARNGVATTIDLLGETVVSEAEADVFLRRNLDVLDVVSRALEREPNPAFSDVDADGPLPRLNLSVKISALTPEVHPADPAGSITALAPRLRRILRRAKEAGAFINFDMESYRLKNLTLALFKSILAEDEFAADAARSGPPAVGIAIQAYLLDAERDLRELIGWARLHARPIVVRLVKGAYWDYETTLARQRGWAVPVWQGKGATDANFEKLSALLLENADIAAPAFATHNVRSCAHAIAQAERLNRASRSFEFQALYGMADDLKHALVGMGYRVREYCAIGELLPGMAYLVRRLLENTSNEGFVRLKNLGEASREQLLENPVARTTSGSTADVGDRADGPASPARASGAAVVPGGARFVNAPCTDFSLAANRERQSAALEACRQTLGRRWPLIIGGQPRADGEFVASINPAHPSQVIGQWARATAADADNAVAAARAAFPAWAAKTADERATILERAAKGIEARRFELNSLEILEAGKPWVEADADISEAVDFCRFYAKEARRLGRPQPTQRVPGELCTVSRIPRGVAAVIAPWNFPLAILTGLTAAPLVAGNSVVMKPAEQTPVIAAAFMEILVEAGVPPGVVNFLPGFGEDVGARLAAHPGIDAIAFTGSRSVGCRIWEAAGRTAPGQLNLKKVVCEMGGKNALIIDNDADLDEAIPAALYSAFGFSGQKCSALSRLIVLAGVYDTFVERFVSACASVPVGDPARPGTVVGPVIDAEARERILSSIERGKAEAHLAHGGTVPAELVSSGGYYVAPTVFVDVPARSSLAAREIFGPVVAILRAEGLDDAIAIANSSEYALTGGLFSRSPSALERARRELLAGNVYLNRGITGAIVERHPFGGFRMSGAGTKAGGEGYLDNFLLPRVVAENVMRRGFTPPETAE